MPEFLASILLCTRNRPSELERCLESLYRLNFENFEVVVVDNGSENFRVPENLQYSRPTRFFSYSVPGLSRARNAVLGSLRGEIIALIDDDAVAEPDWLKEGTRAFGDPKIGCVTGRIVPLETATEWQRKILSNPFNPNWDQSKEFTPENFDPFTSQPGTGSNVFIRASFFGGRNRFPEFLGPGTPACAADEHYLFYQVIRSGWRIRYEPKAVVRHLFPLDEESYKLRVLRGGISRGAYLTRFLFAEPGKRAAALAYLARRSFRANGNSAAGFGTAKRGLVLGPFALLRSMLQKPETCEARLIAEFQ